MLGIWCVVWVVKCCDASGPISCCWLFNLLLMAFISIHFRNSFGIWRYWVYKRWGSYCKRNEIWIFFSFQVLEFMNDAFQWVMMLGIGPSLIAWTVFKWRPFEKWAGTNLFHNLHHISANNRHYLTIRVPNESPGSPLSSHQHLSVQLWSCDQNIRDKRVFSRVFPEYSEKHNKLGNES